MEHRSDVELVHDAHAVIGEGPVWDSDSGTLLWIDILGRQLHRFDRSSGPVASRRLPLDVGAFATRAGGGLVLALQDGFWLADDDGEPRRWVAVEADDPATRFNDGKCDPQGRFWAGTMEYDGAPGRGSLYRLDPDGGVTRHLTDVAISNGLAWTPEGRTMYYIDSPTRRVDAFDFDPLGGTIGGRRTVVTSAPGDGDPDGMTIDTEGGLWVAFYGGGCVRRFDATTGECEMRIDLPATAVTSCAFGGPDLDELYITTGSRDLDAAGRAAEPHAGGLFRIRPGVRGRPADVFAG